MHTLMNGEATDQVDILDRGLNYGDGCFTTIAVIDEQLQLWQRHWQRLNDTCTKLGILVPDEALLLAESEALITEFGKEPAAIKIVITRGSGGRGYAPPKECETRRILSINAIPEHYTMWRTDGIHIANASFRLALQPELAGLKTLNRLEQVLLKQQLGKLQQVMNPVPDDLIVCDANGFVCEATMGNIFWREGKQWHTPELTEAGIAGVVRAEVLANNPNIRIGHYLPEKLAEADEIFVCNSLLGLVPVSNINGSELPVRVYPESWLTRL